MFFQSRARKAGRDQEGSGPIPSMTKARSKSRPPRGGKSQRSLPVPPKPGVRSRHPAFATIARAVGSRDARRAERMQPIASVDDLREAVADVSRGRATIEASRQRTVEQARAYSASIAADLVRQSLALHASYSGSPVVPIPTGFDGASPKLPQTAGETSAHPKVPHSVRSGNAGTASSEARSYVVAELTYEDGSRLVTTFHPADSPHTATLNDMPNWAEPLRKSRSIHPATAAGVGVSAFRRFNIPPTKARRPTRERHRHANRR